MLRVGNCSGFYGDRLSAMREMLEGGELDVLTGDYLAELTMLILGRDQMKDPAAGYARTFLKQVTDEPPARRTTAACRSSRTPAGSTPRASPRGCRRSPPSRASTTRVAYVDGDNLIDRADELGLTGDGKPLTANAYLGAFGIAAALARGADIVVTGRVTDASVVVGPAIAHFGWSRDVLRRARRRRRRRARHRVRRPGDRRQLQRLPRPAGARPRRPAARLPARRDLRRRQLRHHQAPGHRRPGRPSTRSPPSSSTRSSRPRYLGPDVTTHLDTDRSSSHDGADRVRISGVRGSAPPATTKVCLNELGGFRNQMELVLTGLDIDAKADVGPSPGRGRLGAPPARRDRRLVPRPHRPRGRRRPRRPPAPGSGSPSATRRPTRSASAFTAPLVELALASYPGFTMTAPPGPGTPYGVYRAGYVPQSEVPHVVHHPDGSVEQIEPPRRHEPATRRRGRQPAAAASSDWPPSAARWMPAAERAAGRRTHAGPARDVRARAVRRQGRRRQPRALGVAGGDAEARRATGRLAARRPSRRTSSGALLPEAADLEVEVHPLPEPAGGQRGHPGLLGQGVAASSRFDPQAKGLGEWARSRHVDVPEELL